MTVSTSRCNLLLLLASLLFSSVVTATCFFPNGTQQNVGSQADQGIIYKPCDPNAEHSMCCAPWDSCTADGLCRSGYDGNTWRDSCTDPTWKSPACVKLCVSGFDEAVIEAQTDLNMADNDVTVTQCRDSSYCCGNGTAARQCCDNHLGVWINPLTGETTTNNPNPGAASYATPMGTTPTPTSGAVAPLSSNTKPTTSALPFPTTGLSSYTWSSPSTVITSLPKTNLTSPTGNVSTSVPAANTSIVSFQPKSSAISHGSIAYTKPVVGSILVAALFLLAT